MSKNMAKKFGKNCTLQTAARIYACRKVFNMVQSIAQLHQHTVSAYTSPIEGILIPI